MIKEEARRELGKDKPMPEIRFTTERHDLHEACLTAVFLEIDEARQFLAVLHMSPVDADAFERVHASHDHCVKALADPDLLEKIARWAESGNDETEITKSAAVLELMGWARKSRAALASARPAPPVKSSCFVHGSYRGEDCPKCARFMPPPEPGIGIITSDDFIKRGEEAADAVHDPARITRPAEGDGG